jgi:hypothetical protein
MNCTFCNKHIPSNYKVKICDVCGESILKNQVKELAVTINKLNDKANEIQAELNKHICDFEYKVARLEQLQNKIKNS